MDPEIHRRLGDALANRVGLPHMFVMGRKSDTVDLPVPLKGQLRERFSAYYRELAATDPDLTPSSLAAQLLADILSDDLLYERMSNPLH